MPPRSESVCCILIPTRLEQHASTFAEACLRLTPRVALRGAQAVFLHFDHDRIPEAKLRVLCRRFGLEPNRFAHGVDAGAAYTSARWETSALTHLPLEALPDCVQPFLQADAREVTERRTIAVMIPLLRALGLETLHDFVSLPEREISSRFGRAGTELVRRLQRSLPTPWPRFEPAPKIFETIDFQDPETRSACNSNEALIFSLKGTLDRITARLRGRALRISRLEIALKLESLVFGEPTPVRKIRLELPVPQGSTVGLIPILRDRLDAELMRQPLASAPVALRVWILETAPGRGSQRDFFSTREDEAESWDALLGRIGQKLGPAAAFIARPVERHLPEQAWVASAPALLHAADPTAAKPTEVPRPTRLLKHPLALLRQGEHLVVARQPSRRWKILELRGPERLSGEWWLDPKSQGFARDYYRARTECGHELWVYRAGGMDPRFFLHGYFD